MIAFLSLTAPKGVINKVMPGMDDLIKVMPKANMIMVQPKRGINKCSAPKGG